MIPNDITLKTPASFEPSIDYVVTKIPRFAFEKFPGAQPVLTTQVWCGMHAALHARRKEGRRSICPDECRAPARAN